MKIVVKQMINEGVPGGSTSRKKGDTVKMVHKTSGKEIVVVKTTIKKHQKLGFELMKEGIINYISEGKLNKANKTLIEILEYKILKILEARKVVIKVNSKGKRTRKIKCGPGKKLQDGKCVVQKSSEKLARKKGLKKASRTKKAKGAGAARKASKKRAKAMKRRKSQGL